MYLNPAAPLLIACRHPQPEHTGQQYQRQDHQQQNPSYHGCPSSRFRPDSGAAAAPPGRTGQSSAETPGSSGRGWAARRVQAAAGRHQLPVQQQGQGMGAVHPPHLVNEHPGHRLKIRHHRQGLQGRRRELVRLAPGQQAPGWSPPTGGRRPAASSPPAEPDGPPPVPPHSLGPGTGRPGPPPPGAAHGLGQPGFLHRLPQREKDCLRGALPLISLHCHPLLPLSALLPRASGPRSPGDLRVVHLPGQVNLSLPAKL